jgi:hypothetical protein
MQEKEKKRKEDDKKLKDTLKRNRLEMKNEVK